MTLFADADWLRTQNCIMLRTRTQCKRGLTRTQNCRIRTYCTPHKSFASADPRMWNNVSFFLRQDVSYGRSNGNWRYFYMARVATVCFLWLSHILTHLLPVSMTIRLAAGCHILNVTLPVFWKTSGRRSTHKHVQVKPTSDSVMLGSFDPRVWCWVEYKQCVTFWMPVFKVSSITAASRVSYITSA